MAASFLPLMALLLGTPAASARSLTVEQAVALALGHDHGVEAARYGEEKARAELLQAFLQFFPKVSATAGYTRLGQVPYVEFDMSEWMGGEGGDTCENIDPSTLPEGWSLEMAQSLCELITSWTMPQDTGPTRIEMGLPDNYFVKLTLEQVIFAGGALHRAHAAQRAFHEASLAELRRAEHEAAYNAEQGFYQLLLAREAARVSGEALEAVRAYAEDLQRMVDVGLAAEADLLAARARESQAELDALKARHGAELAERVFKAALGIPPEEELELVLDDDPAEAPPLEREHLLAEALSNRPELKGLDANLEALDQLSRAAWSSWLPAVVVQANLNWKNPDYSLEPVWYESTDLTVVASWTLWDQGKALLGHRSARAQREQLRAQRAQLVEMLGVEVQSALSTYDEAEEELEVARRGLAQAEASLEAEQARFHQGVSNNTQLLAAQAAYAGARLSLLQAETKLRMARAGLRKALGLDPEVKP